MKLPRDCPIYPLDRFGFSSLDDLVALGKAEATLKVELGGPMLDLFFNLPPPERIEVREAWFRNESEKLASKRIFKTILGRQIHWNESWIIGVLAADRIPKLIEFSSGVAIQILAVEGITPISVQIPVTSDDNWYSVRSRLAFQIEGQSQGMQLYKERIVLLRAANSEQAVEKARLEVQKLEVPFLTESCKRARWQLEAVLDVYTAFLQSPGLDPDGTEVYSRLMRRRIKSEYEWHPLSESFSSTKKQ